jgi:hypothetical protein
MIAFIDDHRASYGIEPICKVLPIAPSTYHAHAGKRADPGKLSARAKRDMALQPEIARVFAENFEVYGVRKVWRQMVRERFDVARCTGACQEFRVRAAFFISGLHGLCEALAEDDGELRLGHRPFTRRHLPLLFGAVQDEKEQLHRRLVGGEVPSGADGAP